MNKQNECLAAIATSMHFMATGIDNLINTDTKFAGLLDKRGVGQDGFTHELYPYAVALNVAWDDRDQDREAAGVFDYEVSEHLAAHLWLTLDDIDRLDTWGVMIQLVVNIWCETSCADFDDCYKIALQRVAEQQ